jgi:LPXTG-motif cell wall-anchored protein/uncharacterized repeat protein (TIGR01451 family)
MEARTSVLLRRRAAKVVGLALALTGLSVVAPTAAHLSDRAAAATIPIGAIQANVSNHHGTDGGNDTSNCIRYSPTGTSTSSAFVGSTAEALTAHGSDGSCPSTLSTAEQSAIGVKPATTASVQDGVPFLLARVTHYNNPIQADAAHFSGAFTIRMAGFDTTPDLTYNWSMWETPNNANPCPFTGPGVPNQNGCADQIAFTGQVPGQTLTTGGITYKLVMKGFSPTSGTCPAVQPANTQTQFLTAEKATSAACLYAALVQVRSLRIVKRIVSPSGVVPPSTGFVFDGASTINGSAWDDNVFTLTPSLGAPDSLAARELLQGDTVSVTERAPSSDKWSVTAIDCVDGAGGSVDATVKVAAGMVTLPNVPAPPTTAAGPITCTFTNTYTPKATLTLVKSVDGGTALPAQWTLSAQGPTPIAGVSGSAKVTSQRVEAGTYSLDEAGSPLGYTSQGWSCTGGTLTGGNRLALVDNDSAVCTITNRFSRGTFRIVKQVQGPVGGFTGNGDTAFTGTWTCGATTGSFSVTQNTAYTSPEIPSGTVCTVTETQPSGNLANSSWSWNPPAYPDGTAVVIAEGSPPTVTVRNTFAQQTGSLTLGKHVEPRPGAPVAGYTGGSDRTFRLSYDCRIGGATVAAGSVDVADGGTSTVQGIPATATCALSEALTQQPGDFADPSLAWDGSSWTATSVTIAADQTRSATVTNFFTKQTASLTITKRVEGAGYVGGAGQNFTVDWDCGTASGIVVLGRDDSRTVTVPANSSCSVSERAPAGHLDPAHEWGAPTYAGLTDGVVAIPPQASRTVTVTNHTVPVFGAVSITKLLTGATEGVRARATFHVTVDCDNPAEGSTGNFSDTFDLLVNVTQTTPNLPVGTSCTVTEDAPPALSLVDDSYTWGPTPPTQTVTVDSKGSVAAATVTNRVDRAFGSLDVTKVVNGLNGVDGAQTGFSGTWTCTTADETRSGTWSRTGPGPATMTGGADQVLLTSTCTVTENTPAPPVPGDPSYAWGATTIGGSVTLTAATPNGTIAVTNVVVRVTGTFAVAKSVQGGEAGTAFVDGDFTFSYSCSGVLPTSINGTVTVKAGETAQVGTDIPAGSTCTIEESGRPDPISPWDWDGVTIDPTTFTIRAGAPVTVHATNTISQRTVTAQLRKAVDDPDGGFVGNPDFRVSLVCRLDGNTTTYGPEPVKAGGTVSFPGILVGSFCAPVEEPIDAGAGLADASYVWGLPTFSEEQLVSDLRGSYVFTVLNHVERARGALALEKVLDDPDHVTDATRTYAGTWTCTHPGDPDVTGTWSVSGPGPATLTGVPADGILLGSTCHPDEEALTAPPSPTDPSYSWAAPTFTDATPGADSIATMAVGNTVQRRTGQLLVRKSVTGATDGYTGTGADFTVGYTCSLGDPTSGVSGNVDVVAGAAAVVLAPDIPVGWTCHVAEQSPSQGLLVDRSFAWGTPVIDGVDDNGDVTVGAGTATLIVTNPIERLTGDVGVVKALGPTTPDGVVDPAATFSGTYSCRYAGNVVAAGTWSVTGTGAATLAPPADGLPVTTVCSATEDPPDDADLVNASWTWEAPVISDPVTVENAAEPTSVTVTNTPRRVFAPLRVTKVFTGPAAALRPGAEVAGGWACELGGVQVDGGRWRLPASGGSEQIATADGGRVGDNGPIRIPAGSQCTVLEDTPPAGALVDESYAWDDPVSDPASGQVTLVAGQDNVVTVTNSTHRQYGEFRISKVIDLAAELQRPGVLFTGTWSCRHGDDDPVTGAWQVTGEGTDVFAGILLGSVCTVEETPSADSPSLDPSYRWDPPTIAPASVVVTGDPPVQVTVTNPTHRVLTGLTITKRVTGATQGEPAGQTYDLSYSCTDASGGVHTDSRSIAGGATWTTDRVIPMGSRCSVAEGDLPPLGGRFRWGSVHFDVNGPVQPGPTVGQQKSFTFFNPQETGNPPANVTVTNILERHKPGQGPRWTLEKSADPPSGALVRPGTTIVYTLTVTNRSASTPLPAGAVVTDDLSGVLLHTSWGGVRKGHPGRAALQGTALVWTLPSVPPGRVLTLSYSVRVDSGAFGVTLRNSVTARGDVAPSHDCSPTASARGAASAGSAVPCIASTTHHTTQSELGPTQEGPSGTLPNTGAPRYAGWAALLGLLLVALGAGLLIGSRRRRGAPRGG